MTDIDDLAARVLAGDRRALARAITLVENGGEGVAPLLDAVTPQSRRGYRIGVTGPPGAGKSSLVALLARGFRQQGSAKVGVLAVDPTSPFSGGALLGDRVRMTSLSTDPGVFIRSMATRGAFGGLARATSDALDLLDAFGADPLLVETVGVGQSEVEIASLADTTLLVLSPEAGDGVQAMKAGVMEIADVFVVNKADRKGADRLVQDIQDVLSMGWDHHPGWYPPVLKTVASQDGEGIDELLAAVARHRDWQVEQGALQLRRERAARHRIETLVEAALRRQLHLEQGSEELPALVRQVARREVSAHAAAGKLVRSMLGSRGQVVDNERAGTDCRGQG